jgi:hypothetical protein
MKKVTDYRLNKTYTLGKAQLISNSDGHLIPVEIVKFVKVKTDRFEYTVLAQLKANTDKPFLVKTNRLIQ